MSDELINEYEDEYYVVREYASGYIEYLDKEKEYDSSRRYYPQY